jgi:hypothetical protein
MDKSSREKHKLHRLILQVNTNDPAAMNLALNNAMNVAQYYKDLREKVEIEVITFGPGLHMRHVAGEGADRDDGAQHAGGLIQGVWQHPGEHAQG